MVWEGSRMNQTEQLRIVGQKYFAKDLVIGDTVSFADGPWESYTVTKADDQYLTLTRPYLHTSDIAYSGNQLIAYTGLSDMTVARDNVTLLFTLQRGSEVGKAWEAARKERQIALDEIERLRKANVALRKDAEQDKEEIDRLRQTVTERNEAIARYDTKLVDTQLELEKLRKAHEALRAKVATALDESLEKAVTR